MNFITVLIAFLLYFLPTIIAFNRNHASKGAIFIVNLCLGWTFLFWFICIVWCFGNKGASQTVIVNNVYKGPRDE